MNVALLVLISLSWLFVEFLIGGTRLLYSLPAYGLVSIAAILAVGSFRSRRPPPDWHAVGGALVLAAWVAMRAQWSPVPYLAWPDYYMVIACLMTYLLTALFLTGIVDRTALILVLWGICLVQVWVAIIQFGKDPHFMLFGFRRPGVGRSSGLYISPNNLAGYLAAGAMFALSFVVWSRWKLWAKLLAVYMALCCFAGIAVSGSRGGYFDTIGSLLCFATISSLSMRAIDSRKFLPMAIGWGAGIAVVVAAAAVIMGHSELLTHRMQSMVASDVRLYNWQAALDHIRVSPLVGTGAGTHLYYGRLFRRPQIQADPVHAHCDYLELLAEYGVIGGLCMVFFIWAHASSGIRAFMEIMHRRMIHTGFHQSNNFAIQVGALCAVFGLAIHSIFDFDMHIPGNALLFAFIFGILANPGIAPSPRRGVQWVRFALPILGIWMLVSGMPKLPSEWITEEARSSLRDGKYRDAITYGDISIGRPQPELPAAPRGDVMLFGKPATTLTDAWAVKAGGANPLNPNNYLYLGEANRLLAGTLMFSFVKKDGLTAADEVFREGLRIFPQDENLIVREAQTLDGLRRFDEADACYREAMKVDPYLGVIRDLYVEHLKAAGKMAEAEQFAREAVKIEPLDSEKIMRTEFGP